METTRGNDPDPELGEASGRSLTWLLIGLTLLSMTLHGLHLLNFLQVCRSAGADLYWAPDTISYQAIADNYFGSSGVPMLYRDRLLYPILLRLFEAVFHNPASLLWLNILTDPVGLWSVTYLACLLTGRRRAGVVAACLYILYPGTYENEVTLLTDVLHAHIALAALACTAGWTYAGRRRMGIAAVFLWPLAQLLRPSLFMVALILPLLLWRAWPQRRTQLGIVMMAATLVVPGGLTARNYFRFGIPSPTLFLPEAYHRNLVPMMKALMQNDVSPVSISKAFYYEREVVARQDPDYQNLVGADGGPAYVRESSARILARDKAFVRAHPTYAVNALLGELIRQDFINPLSYTLNTPQTEKDFVPERVMRVVQKLGMFAACWGWLLMFTRGRKDFALFSLAWAILLTGPILFLPYGGDRYRLPIDLILLVFVADALLTPVVWISGFSILFLAYVPFKWLGMPKVCMNGLAATLFLVAVAWEARSRFKPKREREARPVTG